MGREGKSNYTVGNLTNILTQVIRVNINRYKTCRYHALLICYDVIKVVLYFCVLSPKTQSLIQSNYEKKKSVKSQLKIML